MELETLHGRVYATTVDGVYVTVPWTRFLSDDGDIYKHETEI